MLKKIDRFLNIGNNYLIVMLLSLTIIFSLASLVFRWIHVSSNWVEPLIRHMVFLMTFVGGASAAGKSGHIAIDILLKVLERFKLLKLKKILIVCTSFLSLGTLVWLVYAGIQLVFVEMEFGQSSFLGIHTSILVAIIPFGFAMIFIRLFSSTLCAVDGVLHE